MASENSQHGLNEDPQEYVENSIGGLIRKAVEDLENECASITQDIEEKTKTLKELNDNIAKQAQNIANQSLEQEHLKALINKEAMNREAIIVKNSAVREKYTVLEKHFPNLFKGINLAQLSKDQLLQILQQKSILAYDGKQSYLEVEQKYNKAVEEAEKDLHNIEKQKDVERQEFAEIKDHLLAQHSILIKQEKELEGKFRELQSTVREKTTSFNMLKSRNVELESTFDGLKNGLSIEVVEVNSNVKQLQTKLQDQLTKKKTLTENLEELEIMNYNTTNSISKEEDEIDKSDKRQRELSSKEEECTKILEVEKQSFTNLELQAESMKAQLSKLLNVDEENSRLKINCKQLEERHDYLKTKALELENVEESYIIQIKGKKMEIEELENNIKNIKNEVKVINDKIKDSQLKMEEDKNNFKHLSTEIDKPYKELTEKNITLNKTIESLAIQLRIDSKNKESFDETIRNLTVELERAKAFSEKSDNKLFNQKNELTMVQTEWKTKNSNLENMIANVKQEYSKAQDDAVLHENTKKEIKSLEVQLENNRVANEKLLENMRASHNNLLESKSQQMAELRMQFEREYRNKEQTKTDALVELKEIKSRTEELIKQKGLVKNETERVQNNLMKCENLVHRLENKLKVVAHVATEDHSQSVSGNLTQQSNFVDTSHKNGPGFQSPRSDSSALTFNKKPKKEKKAASPDLNDWGF